MELHQLAPAGAQGLAHRVEAVKECEIGLGTKRYPGLAAAISRLALARRSLLTSDMTRTMPLLAHACLPEGTCHAAMPRAIRTQGRRDRRG
jgi:hypothetical protein